MTVQHVMASPRANLVEARRPRRIVAVVTAFAIEAILIASVVLSSIGASPAWHPTPGGAGAEQIPAPAASGETR